MKIALLGSIPKGDDLREGWVDWKKSYKNMILEVMPHAEFIDGDAISDNAGAELVVGHDLAMVRQADICVVDARSKIGAGTAQEIVIAKLYKKPVVIVIPKNSHHRKSNMTFHGTKIEEWIHPFLKISTDYIADDAREAAQWIKNYEQAPHAISIKGIDVFDEAIRSYESSKYIH